MKALIDRDVGDLRWWEWIAVGLVLLGWALLNSAIFILIFALPLQLAT